MNTFPGQLKPVEIGSIPLCDHLLLQNRNWLANLAPLFLLYLLFSLRYRIRKEEFQKNGHR
jgi:hypothetical protein